MIVAKRNERSYRKAEWCLFMKSPNKLPSYAHSLIYFIHSSFHPHPHKPQDACAEVVWLTRVWHKGHGTSNPYHISWHFLDWQSWTNFWTDDLYPLGVPCCYGVVLYTEYFFLQSLSLRQGDCSLPVFLHLINTCLYRCDLLSCWAYRQENGICHML